MRIVCLADTHGKHHGITVPEGDILIHAGDGTMRGTLEETLEFSAWFRGLPHPRKIFVAGNHDFLFEREPAVAVQALGNSVTYLQDSDVTIEGVRIWGSPWQPWFFDWAFNLQRGKEIKAKWDLIPEGIDVLVTHGPPLGHGDTTRDGKSAGCSDLLDALDRVRPKLHVFGHIHESYGRFERDGMILVNASSCTFEYDASNPVIVVEI